MSIDNSAFKGRPRGHRLYSGYKGISFSKGCGLWVANLKYKGFSYLCGYYDTEKKAIIARDTCILKNNLPLKLQILTKK